MFRDNAHSVGVSPDILTNTVCFCLLGLCPIECHRLDGDNPGGDPIRGDGWE